ncbi:glycosyltransferase [Planctomycetota bacterium]|nr:glycosyltransferase [Planctomycetota bacterium]
MLKRTNQLEVKMLHIVREGGGLGCPCGLMKLRGLLGIEDVKEHVMVLGRQAILEECEELGIEGVERIGTPGGSGVSGFWTIRKRMRELGNVDVVSCDDVGVLWAVDRVMRGAKKILWVSKLPVGRRLWWLRKYFGKRGGGRGICVIAVSTEAMKGQLMKLGFDGEMIRVIGVGVNEGKIERNEDVLKKLRVKWGAVGKEMDCFVVGVMSDRPMESDTRLVSLAGGTASIVMQSKLGKAWQLRVLINPTHLYRDRSINLNDEFGHVGLLVQERGTSRGWEIGAGCDALLVVGETSEDSLAWACASGKPVMCENDPRLRELVGAEESGVVMFEGNDLRKPSDQITKWAMDGGMREVNGKQSREWALKRFGLSEQRERFGMVIRELCGA